MALADQAEIQKSLTVNSGTAQTQTPVRARSRSI